VGGNAVAAPGAQTDKTAACNAATGNNGIATSNCVNCLNSQGYWLNYNLPDNNTSTSAGVFMGNWLNFYPPKWVLMNLAYRRLEQNGILNTLRTAVAGVNGLNGAKSLQKMLPQSCQGQGRPKSQALGSLDNILYTSTGHPLAESLFNAAWYLGGQPGTSWVFTSNSTFQYGPSPQTTTAIADGSKSAPCNGCNGNFTVVFSDGRGDSGNPGCRPDSLGNLSASQSWCTAKAYCFATDTNPLGMGAEGDGDDFLDPSITGGAGAAISGSTARQTPPGTCEFDFADDVAGWMANNDVGGTAYPGSHVSTFTIGIGSGRNGRLNILKEMASRGNGSYQLASDYASLEAATYAAINSIIRRSTSFSTAAITTVQTRGQTFAFIPRFLPAPDNEWQGKLFRFNLFNEFAAGCTSADYNKVTALNPNGNASCSDVYLQDKNSNFIGEDSQGNFVQQDSTQPYNADAGGFPIKYVTGADGGTTTVPAVPVWEAAQVLTNQLNATADGGTATQRTIYTVEPDGTGGYSPTLVQLTPATVPVSTIDSTLVSMLKLNGATSQFCANLGISTRHQTYYTNDQAGENNCAQDLINYIIGQDVMLQDPNNRSTGKITGARPSILGDIFHSSPILVTPPVNQTFCSLGFLNQCVATLFTEGSTSAPGGNAAYKTYLTNNANRRGVLVVGANDGMIHAFDTGLGTDLGTGAEVWAFIPPDMMPKLQRYVLGGRHELLVDGTPMVRDIWYDANKDGIKQASEYHTVAIVPEREGGHFYTALSVDNTQLPVFLWSWPKPGTTESLVVGETWNDHAPSAPPIGPVLIQDTTAAGSITSKSNGTTVKARETYVVAVGGGFDPNYLRGRGIYVLDAWTGQEYYRFAREDSGGASDPANNLFPVAATPAMLDTDYDNIFDTIVVGDVGGQLWTINMKNAGLIDSTSGLIKNWYGARSFVEFKGQALYKRSPFFAIASVQDLQTSTPAFGVTSDYLRVLIGSGDRNMIKDIGGNTCGPRNLRACIRKDCAVDIKATRNRIGATPVGGAGGHSVTGEWSYGGAGATAAAIDTYAVDQTTLTQSAQCTDAVDAAFQYVVTCGGTTTTYNNTAYCDWGATTECPDASGQTIGANAPGTSSVTQENAEFYAVRLYGDSTGGATTSTNRKVFTNSADAQTYDTNAFTETSLVDVTTAGNTGTVTYTGNGWRYIYQTANEKTANGALVLASTCVIWSSLIPNAGTVSCSGTIPPDTANTYQGNIINGGIGCGQSGSQAYSSTTRYTSHSALVAPPPFTAVLSVNSSNQYALTGISLQPGVAPQTVNGGIGDLSNFRYWLEVPRSLHACRHATGLAQSCQ
jgi:type IV pilus assembly protein PilY1